jgi:hypothetical protein
LRQLCSQGLQLRLRELGDKVQHGVALERIGRRQDGEPADLARSPKRPEHDLLAVNIAKDAGTMATPRPQATSASTFTS